MRLISNCVRGGIALAVLGCASTSAADKVTVAITAIVEHPLPDAARAGIRKALEDAGYKEGDTLDFDLESAQGASATAAQNIKNRDHPGGNVTSISDPSPLGAHLDLTREILPLAVKIGVLFNPAIV